MNEQTIETPPQAQEQLSDFDSQLDQDLGALFNKQEAKPEIKTEEPKPEIKVEETKNAEEPKVEKSDKNTSEFPDPNSIQDPNFKSKKSKEGWDVLKSSYAKLKEESEKNLKSKDEELLKVKAALAEKGQATSKEAETLKKEIDELKGYRAMVDYQADPEFIKSYDSPIEKLEGGIKSLLTDLGVSEAIIQQIDYTNSTQLDSIADTLAEKKDKIVSRKFLNKAEEIHNLYEKREEAIKDYRKNYKQVLEEKKKQSFNQQAENEGRAQKHIEEVAQRKDEKGQPIFPFLSMIEAKDPNNQAEVERAARHNKVVETFRARLEEFSRAETPEDRAEVNIAAVASHWLTAVNNSLMKKVESLEKELQSISKSGSATPKSQKTVVSRVAPENLDVDAALSQHFPGR